MDKQQTLDDSYDYTMPLSGADSSGSVEDTRSPRNVRERSIGIDRWGGKVSDGTPRQRNVNYTEETQKSPRSPTKKNSLDKRMPPPLPLYQPSQRSLLSAESALLSAESASSLGDFHESTSIASQSYSQKSGNASYSQRSASQGASNSSPAESDSRIMQIGFDGAVNQLAVKSNESVGSSANRLLESHPSQSHSHAYTHHALAGDEEINDGNSSAGSDVSIEPIVLWGVRFPMWLTVFLKKPPSLARVSFFVVRSAPCFWCCGNSLRGSSSDRAILIRLNILCIFFTFIQLVAAVWLATLLLIVDDQSSVLTGFAPNFWNLNGATFAVGVLALFIIVTCICTSRIIKEVDLVGAIRYLWVVLWIIPCETFFDISLFDYHRVTGVWLRHW